MTTEERQLADMLHRITPEPPRQVTVEDVAFRLASDAGKEPRRRLTSRRGWAPALAAASIVVIAGASAGLATALTSHSSHNPAPGGGAPVSSASSQNSSPAPSPASPAQTAPAGTPLRIADGMWDAKLITRQSFTQGTLAGSGNSLYVASADGLDRIDLASGRIVQSVPYSPPIPQRPVVIGNTVWVVWSYSDGDITLRGYDTTTLAQVASVPVPVIGGVVSSAAGVLAAGPDGKLYVAAGDSVATVDPAAGRVTHRISLAGGRASSVAVAPDGSKLYVGAGPSGSFRLLVYDLATGNQALSSQMSLNGAGNLVATSGGVWGTTGIGMSEWVWFAPGGDLTRSFRVSQGAGAGLDSLPTSSGGAVWIGGTHELVCASPATGKAMARTIIPADHSIVEHFGSVTVLGGGRAYALYQDQAAHLSGVAALTPPRACSG